MKGCFDLKFLIADTDVTRQSVFRQGILNLSWQKNFDYELYSASQAESWRKIPAHEYSELTLAFINMDYQEALDLGIYVYESNPFCRLTYYAENSRNIVPVLPSRPVRYAIVKSSTAVETLLNKEYNALLKQRGVFRYADRFQKLLIPHAAIFYFTSHDRAVYYVTAAGEYGPLRRTLDQIEQNLERGIFIRCHKSFLVRREICAGFDKRSTELILTSGERLPISRANLLKVAAMFDEKNNFGS